MRRVTMAVLLTVLAGCGGDGYRGDDPNPGAGLGAEPGSGILFVRDVPGVSGSEEIWVMHPDGSGQVRLTDDRRQDSDPQWSPDGTKILFVRQSVSAVGGFPENDADVWVMNADGSGKTNLTQDAAEDFQPAWSPDGRQIAFVSDRDGSRDIFLMDADGSNVHNLTRNDTLDEDPAFSPDGTKLAFQTGREAGDLEIYVMNLDGSGLTNVSRHPEAGDFGRVAWSPDGSKILFRSSAEQTDPSPDPEGQLLWVVNADGSGRRQLDSVVQAAVFTADSAQVVYASEAMLNIINVDGSGRRLLVESFEGEFPVLGPDGRRVAFAHAFPVPDEDPTRVVFNYEIHVVGLDGSHLARLTNDPGLDRPTDWR
jgi:dipeptidyl aminopeptidase/acylaminoacyl peptidase